MATFTVTTLLDENDPGATVAVPGNAGLSLREAIALANSIAGADTIQFGVSGTITLVNGQLTISSDVTIDGDVNGDDKADIAVSGNNVSRVFNISGGATAISTKIESLTIQGGRAFNSSGGGILVDFGDTLTLIGSTVSGNTAFTQGGGILNLGTAVLVNTTISENNVSDSGGGITNHGQLTLTNVTVWGNNAGNEGGGIDNSDTLTLNSSTVTGNAANLGNGGGILSFGISTVNIANSIVAGNDANGSGDDVSVSGSFNQSGINLLGAPIADVFASIVSVDPPGAAPAFNAGALADNGGPVKTVAIKIDGLARDTGANASLPTDLRDLDGDGVTAEPLPVDARGLARVVGANTDIGAFEAGNLVVTTLDDELDAADTSLATYNPNDLSLREAIALANSNADANTITFATGPGTIRLTHAAGSLVVSTAMTVDGDIDGDNAPDITITGDKANNDTTLAGGITDLANTSTANLADNVAIIYSTGTAGLTFNGLILTGGSGASGGAINAANELTLTNSVVSGNQSDALGGGIAVIDGDATLTNVTLSGNRSTLNGAGGIMVVADGSTLRLTDSIVSGNSAADGVNGAGGGIYAWNATVLRSTVSRNTAGIDGGGMYLFGDADITDSTISGNTSGSAGGGVFANNAVLKNVTVSGNTAVIGGGGVFVNLNAMVTNSTITGNNGGAKGGGIDVDTGTLINSIVMGNRATTDADIFAFSSPVVLTGGNIVGTQFSINGAPSGAPLSAAQVFAATVDIGGGVLAGVLANNGGVVQTVALNTAAANRALDAGNDTLAPASDARGVARQDATGAANNGTNTSDLGAFEAEANASIGDRIWNDIDGDGVQDAGEAGISGVTVELVDSGSNVVATTTTGANGNYLFSSLLGGTYSVRLVAPASYGQRTYDLDGTGTADIATVTLAVGQNRTDVDFGYRSAVPAIVGLNGDAANYQEDEPAVLLDTGTALTFTDADLNGGEVRVQVSANEVAAEDVLGIRQGGTVTVAGGVVSVGGTAIGTITSDGTGGNDLVVALNSNANQARVETLLRELTYFNSNTVTPNTATRSVTVEVSDGVGGTATATTTVTVAAVNDTPVITAPTSIAVVEDEANVLTGISFSDEDAGNGSVEAVLSVIPGEGTFTTTAGSGVTVVNIGNRITLTGSISDINAYIASGHVSYTTAPDANGSVTLGISIDDNGNSGGPDQFAIRGVQLAITPVVDIADPFDFNGDGKGDILFQNRDGTPAVWLLDGTGVMTMGPPLPNPNAGQSSGLFDQPAPWREIGSGDFNGDGKSDILWQHTSGTAGVWLMDGVNVLQIGGGLPNPGPSWKAKEAADFNGDGKSDILWQNDNGAAGVWLMNGTGVQQIGGALPNPGASWHTKAAADFNGDGKADILWQNDNGLTGVWLMDGTTVLQTGGALPIADASWHAEAAGDFNGDGKADILWQHDNGTAAVWLMDGTTVLSMGGALANPGPTWHVKEAVDTNGDGKSDILWQNDNGTPGVWLMNGTSVQQTGGALHNPGAAWHIV